MRSSLGFTSSRERRGLSIVAWCVLKCRFETLETHFRNILKSTNVGIRFETN